MASKLDDSVRSERDSIVYDDVVSQADLSKDSITTSEDVQEKVDTGAVVKGNECVKASGEKASELTKESQKKGLSEHSSTADKLKNVDGGKEVEKKDASSGFISKHNVDKSDDNEPHKDKRRMRKDSNDKELWTPIKNELVESKDSKNSDNRKTGDVAIEDSPDTHPTKPPRRHPQKKPDGAGSGELEQKTSPSQSPGKDPVKPPRRRLPQTPKSTVTSGAKPDLPEKTQSEGGSTTSDDGLSVTSDGTEQKPTEIVCKPVLTSSPNQDEIPNLSVETVDKMDTSRRVLSFLDESSDSGVRKVESFYDFLYSREDINTVGEVTSPILKEGDRIGSALSDSDDHLYDSVPVGDSVAESFSRKSGFESYDEVIVNQEAYVMPSHEDESDEFSDSDPWGSDFETEDDMTDAGSLRTQTEFNDEEEEDPYDSVEISPMRERKRPFRFVSEVASFSPFSSGKKSSLGIPGLKGQIKGCLGLNKAPSLPYLASNQKDDEADAVYVDPDITDSVNYQQPVMPPMPEGLSTEQIKRYQIVKFMLESEADYMRLLDQLSKQYELPIRERDLLEPNKIDIIFQHVHRVLQCHAMFNIALSARMADWTPEEKVGDILYALFCKSMVLDAYSGYVNNFAKAMDTVKVACRTHLAFAQFLKSRRQSSREHHSLHHLMLKPVQRFPQILALLQELLLVTPRDHPDRVPLQLALTQLECLAESLKERKREAELRSKVKLLDGLVAQSHKPLASGNRYFIRQDDFVQCTVEGESILGTKKRRIIMLSDMLLCVSLIKGKKDRAMHMVIDPKAKYKLKWNVPLNDVDIVEYGPGVNILTSSYRTTISHSNEGQYRSTYSGCREHFEDLQQDLAVIGQIAGLVATLRRSYRVLDIEKVQHWHKAVQRTMEEETRLANLYWLELSLPSKHGHVNYIFSTDSPSVKAEWVTALNTSKLRLAPENNPGWYLPEDDGTGGVAIQRRNMPLLKDNSSLFLLSQKAKIQCIVSCPDTEDPLPGIHDNYNTLWLLCGGGDHAGHVTVVKVSLSSPPQVVESFHVCESNIMCGEYVERTCGEEKKFKGTMSGRFGFPFPTVWLGTQGGRIFIYNAVDSTRRYVMSVKLPDAILAIKTVNMKIFAGVADGSVVIFKRNQEGTWNFSEPKAVGLGKFPVMAMAVVRENLWCSCGNKLFVINHDEEVIKHVIEVDENPKTSIKHLVSYGVGVWVSVWKFPSIKLFHGETLKHVQDISIVSPVTNMQRDIDSQLEKTKLDQVYATALAADEGLLWVGTSVGVTLVFPLPRLEGIPLVSGKACVAFHSYCSSVRCFFPLKNNPSPGTGHGPEGSKLDYSLFREHEVRDACVQTDAGVSGAWSYASRGPALANQNKASPKKGDNSKMPVNGRQTTDQGGEGEEDYSDEDVHSDDEFSFVEDKQNTLNGMRIPRITSVGTASSTGSFSVRFEGSEEPAKSPTASSVQSEDLVGKTEFRVDDFARMLSEFKGFGGTPPPSIPEPPRIPLVIVNEQSPPATSVDVKGDGTSAESQETGRESAVSGEATGSVPALGEQESGSGSETADFRGRVKSVGEYVKLNDARAAAEAQGIKLDSVHESNQASKDQASAKSDLRTEVESKSEKKTEAGSLVATSVDVEAPSYIEVLSDTDARAATRKPETPKTPEVIYDSPRQDDSYSVFERSQVRDSVAGTLTTPKVENLKPRLPFPVLLVSAGEGYADLRRKRPDENDKEPRVMIWQIS